MPRRSRPLILIAASLAAVCAGPSAWAVSIEAARHAVVVETLKYLNTPYLWGGEHPVTGFDCSGFVQQVYRDNGFSLPRVSRDQFQATHPVSPRDVHPGDLIFFAMENPGTAKVDHVGIYMGRGYFIAASTTHGIYIEPIKSTYYLPRLVAIRKFSGF